MVKLLLEFVAGKSPTEVTDILAEEPYAVRVRGHQSDPEHKRRYVFSYHMINSDFNELLVWECRGTILECEITQTIDGKETTYYWKPVAVPFRKFFNAGEKYNRHIPDGFDWSTAEIFPKEDGSLIKLYHYETQWYWGTNNGICAKGAPLPDETRAVTKYQNFHDLIDEVADQLSFEELNPNHTYLFELVSPYNRVVVNKYNEIKLILLAIRCRNTFEEKPVIQINGIDTVKPVKLTHLTTKDKQLLERLSLEAKKRPGTEFEGFVVRDSRGYRLKIKNPEYVMLHHTKSRIDSMPGEILILMGWLKGEIDEILAVRPKFKDKADELIPIFEKYLESMCDFEARLKNKFGSGPNQTIDLNSFTKEDRKQFANEVKLAPNSGLFFALYGNKLKNIDGDSFTKVEDYLRSQTGIDDVKILYKSITQ